MLLWLEHLETPLRCLITLVSANVNHQMKLKIFAIQNRSVISFWCFLLLYSEPCSNSCFFYKYEAQLSCSRFISHVKVFKTCSSWGKLWSCSAQLTLLNNRVVFCLSGTWWPFPLVGTDMWYKTLQLYVQLVSHCFQVNWTIYRIYNHFKYLSFTKVRIATVVLPNNSNATDCSVAVKSKVVGWCSGTGLRPVWVATWDLRWNCNQTKSGFSWGPDYNV